MPKIRIDLYVPETCEVCKHAVPHYNPICISYICDLFNEEVGFSAITCNGVSKDETAYYKCDKCKQAEIKDKQH